MIHKLTRVFLVDEKIAVGNYIYFTKASQLTAAKTKLITMDSQHSFPVPK